jgi:hypothetical protein
MTRTVLSREDLKMQHSIRRVQGTTVLVVFLLLILAGSAVTQQDPTTQSNKDLPVNELLKLRGKVVAEGTASRVLGNSNIAGYRVEELQLPRTLNVELQGRPTSVDRAWRITINGGPFPVRDLPAVIWIDDQIAGYGIENETLSQITAITFDSSLIREGALISLSYGDDKDTRLKPAQRLHLKREGGNQ